MNKKISAETKDANSPLLNVPLVMDPRNEIAEVLVEALEWNMLGREWNVSSMVARAVITTAIWPGLN